MKRSNINFMEEMAKAKARADAKDAVELAEKAKAVCASCGDEAAAKLKKAADEKALNETTAKEYSDKAFVDNKTRAKMQGMFKEDQWTFEPNGMLRTTMKSNSGSGSYKISLFPFKLADVLEQIDKAKAEGKDVNYSEMATSIVRGDIAPFCDCPNFIYQNAGPRGAGRQLLNPSGGMVKSNFGLCKHLLFPVQTFPFLQSMYADKLKKGFFDKAAVLKQSNDGRTKAFLNESEPIGEDSCWVVLEADQYINTAIDYEASLSESAKPEAKPEESENLNEAMTRQHFGVIASAMSKMSGCFSGGGAKERALDIMASELAGQNDGFNKAKFIEACLK
jgi:hypothetical protein